MAVDCGRLRLLAPHIWDTEEGFGPFCGEQSLRNFEVVQSGSVLPRSGLQTLALYTGTLGPLLRLFWSKNLFRFAKLFCQAVRCPAMDCKLSPHIERVTLPPWGRFRRTNFSDFWKTSLPSFACLLASSIEPGRVTLFGLFSDIYFLTLSGKLRQGPEWVGNGSLVVACLT
jgi:hypothetical protein